MYFLYSNETLDVFFSSPTVRFNNRKRGGVQTRRIGTKRCGVRTTYDYRNDLCCCDTRPAGLRVLHEFFYETQPGNQGMTLDH